MNINKKKLHFKLGFILSTFVHGIVGGATIDGPLVQQDEKGVFCVNPIMSETLTQELHSLCKRSYRITSDKHADPESLTKPRRNIFQYDGHTSIWQILKAFTGLQGAHVGGLVGLVTAVSSTEVIESDNPGFIAVKQRVEATETTPATPPIIAIVFRGTQAKHFQLFNGILGPSWLTNFASDKMNGPEDLNLQDVCFHRGFFEKYLLARESIEENLREAWRLVGEDPETRFIITGHSQGGGITFPAAYHLVKTYGPVFFGPEFNNVTTPRFFVYALSSPFVVGNEATKELMHNLIGRNNMIRHSSLFDIVTYSCLSTTYSSCAAKVGVKLVCGGDTCYHPVGFSAFDDPKALIERGFEYNEKDTSLVVVRKKIDMVVDNLLKLYDSEISARRTNSFFMDLFYRALDLAYGTRAVEKCEGLGNFVVINHYGSTTANVACYPEGVKPTESKGSSSFDPRLPETDLSVCLRRGAINRSHIKSSGHTRHPSQELTQEPPTPLSLCIKTYKSRAGGVCSDGE